MPFWTKFSRHNDSQATPLKAPSPSSLAAAQLSLESFGLALLQQECSARPHQTVFISPLSVFLALAMIENGAVGETKAAIHKALTLPTGADDQACNESIAVLIKSFQPQGGAELAIANALWIDVRTTISPDFATLCRDFYDATCDTLDLSKSSSTAAINAWVSEKTRGKIPAIVTPDEIAGLYTLLTNTVYFKGGFLFPFPKGNTRPVAFYLSDGREKPVPMMRRAGLYYGYCSGMHCEAAILPYQDSTIELCMLLPNRGISPEQILTAENMQSLGREKSCNLDLSMPRFTIDFGCSLKPSLTHMGMGVAFQFPDADFSSLGSPPLFIGDVMHKTRLEVDEEGTVAAAATHLPMPFGAPPRIETKTLVFDRPFGVLLIERRTGAIVFAGVVYEP